MKSVHDDRAFGLSFFEYGATALSHQAIVTYMVLRSYLRCEQTNGIGSAWEDQEVVCTSLPLKKLAALAKLRLPALQRALAELERVGWIKMTRNPDGPDQPALIILGDRVHSKDGKWSGELIFADAWTEQRVFNCVLGSVRGNKGQATPEEEAGSDDQLANRAPEPPSNEVLPADSRSRREAPFEAPAMSEIAPVKLAGGPAPTATAASSPTPPKKLRKSSVSQEREVFDYFVKAVGNTPRWRGRPVGKFDLRARTCLRQMFEDKDLIGSRGVAIAKAMVDLYLASIPAKRKDVPGVGNLWENRKVLKEAVLKEGLGGRT